ncbi:MAG: NUDIX domain-containing protein [Candidatus Calescibacterium sp.]|nr:NUDIX domain-containing protein [Candidatus Calescibacterium sp.]MCX7971771.1 NUDIX domain-containing protein [bacterium]MDW8195377.1 NUDIX domain-containing protein [Candidatus Calescibacterium sp.]
MRQKRVISAGGIILWKGGNNIWVCIVKRKGKNIWILPRGRVEDNENMEDTVVREIREETGIISKVLRKVGVIKYNYYSREGFFCEKEVHFYLVKITKYEKFVPNEEIQDMKWVPVEDALKTLSYPKEREILLKALKHIL